MGTKKHVWAAALLLALSPMGNQLNAQNMEKKEIPQHLSDFPIGEPNTCFTRYFIGQSYLAPLTSNGALNCPVSNVTFEPACRNNWHSHTGGQLLIAVGGRGYYQEKGKPARLLLPGDVVEIAPDVVHWHGAAPDSWFSHLAISTNPQTSKTTWLEPVNDEEYAAATTCAGGLSAEASRVRSQWYPADGDRLEETDPELAAVFGNFAFGETQQYGDLDARSRVLVTMASAVAQNTPAMLRRLLDAAVAVGLTPAEIKEVLYHAVPYVGMARVRDLLPLVNEFLAARGVALPLEPQAAVTPETRMEKGLALQKSMFGDANIDAMYKNAPANQPDSHSALPLGQLLRRLPDPPRIRREDPRAADLLHPRLPRRMRAASEGPHRRQRERGQRQGDPAGRRHAVAPLHRLSPHAERHLVPQRGAPREQISGKRGAAEVRLPRSPSDIGKRAKGASLRRRAFSRARSPLPRRPFGRASTARRWRKGVA